MKLLFQYTQFLFHVLADNLVNLLAKETFRTLKNQTDYHGTLTLRSV